jgi:hypothetical protein
MREIDMFGTVDAPPDKDQTVAVEDGETDARAIGQIFEAHGAYE